VTVKPFLLALNSLFCADVPLSKHSLTQTVFVWAAHARNAY